MKWKQFRALTPVERRLKHGKAGAYKRALARWLKEAKNEARFERYFSEDINPFLTLLGPILLGLQHADSPKEFEAWLKWHLPNPSHKGFLISAPQALVTSIKTDPHFLLGFWNEKREYVPGVLSAMSDDAYTDTVEEILSVEILSGLTIDEVVSLCARRGQKTNNDAVRQRVMNWESQ